MTLHDLFKLCQSRLENLFQYYLAKPDYPDQSLKEAMIYSVQNGGKRIRPTLVYATGYVLDTPWENCDAAAAAVELIHAYSLIHDDLPAMDNADLRRGKPACHKAFGEATAILAGDALQPLAFEMLVTHPSTLSAEQRLLMIHTLSHASGLMGMASGQALDLAGVRSIEALNQMYQLKTGALLTASVKLGIIASQHQDKKTQQALQQYIENIGLAFQIQDDLLDVQGDSNITGKTQGLDYMNQKITYPSILGIEKTQATIQSLFSNALSTIEFLGNHAEILRELAYYLLQRNR